MGVRLERKDCKFSFDIKKVVSVFTKSESGRKTARANLESTSVWEMIVTLSRRLDWIQREKIESRQQVECKIDHRLGMGGNHRYQIKIRMNVLEKIRAPWEFRLKTTNANLESTACRKEWSSAELWIESPDSKSSVGSNLKGSTEFKAGGKIEKIANEYRQQVGGKNRPQRGDGLEQRDQT